MTSFVELTHLIRRALLRGAGFTLALPFLEAMRPVFGRRRERTDAAAHGP